MEEYELVPEEERELGHGGFGVVKKVRRKSDQMVCIKLSKLENCMHRLS
jgi:hypothetical protein